MSAGTGHYRSADPSKTQNQGNALGDRPCVKQSRVGREHMGGNAMKDIMGQSDLKWDSNQQQGAYQGKGVVGGVVPRRQETIPPPQKQWEQPRQAVAAPPVPQPVAQQQEAPAPLARRQSGHSTPGSRPWATDDDGVAPAQNPYRGRPGAGQANRTTFNLFGGQ